MTMGSLFALNLAEPDQQDHFDNFLLISTFKGIFSLFPYELRTKLEKPSQADAVNCWFLFAGLFTLFSFKREIRQGDPYSRLLHLLSPRQ